MTAISGFPCPEKVTCPGSDDPVANLSAEGYDQRKWISRIYPQYLWRDWCCGYVCESTISQEAATICAENMARYANAGYCSPRLQPNGEIACSDPIPPPAVDGMFGNSLQCAEIMCPDGSMFTWCTAANTYYASTQEEADSIALSNAQEKVHLDKFCCGTNLICCCVGGVVDFTLAIDGGTGPFNWVPVGGSWPTGLAVDFSDDNRSGHITGIATTMGTSLVDFVIYDANGNYLTKTFTVHAIEITTTSLPDFTQGTPYSYQMTAGGGSGSYAWMITSGTLPTGLTMSVGGLISGTPTATSTATLTFDVIDLACEATNRYFYPPRVALSGRNTTTIATIKGFSPYIQTTTPPKRYKKLAWTGTSEQWATALGSTCAGAKYIWSGTSEINLSGTLISKYKKDYYTQCPSDVTLPTILSFIPYGITVLEGYCWPSDPNSCPICPPSPYTFTEDRSSNSSGDVTTFLNDPLSGTHTITEFSLTNVSGATAVVGLQGSVGIAPSDLVIIHSSHNYSSLISEEYTDADALSVATHWHGNGRVAENRPRTTGFTSTWTTVQFTLGCSNLLVGENYTVSVEFWSNTGALLHQTYSFIAAASTHLIVDNIPTPAAGYTLEVRNPEIAFA